MDPAGQAKTVDYQPAAAAAAQLDRQRRAARFRSQLASAAAAAVVAVVVGGAAAVTYLHVRNGTTVAEVRGWFAALPRDATPAQVQAVFAARGMEWGRIAAEHPWGCPPGGYDPTDRDGLQGFVRGVRGLGDVYRQVVVTVRFDRNGRAKSVVVEEHITPD